jgi:hypothetical protein
MARFHNSLTRHFCIVRIYPKMVRKESLLIYYEIINGTKRLSKLNDLEPVEKCEILQL